MNYGIFKYLIFGLLLYAVWNGIHSDYVQGRQTLMVLFVVLLIMRFI